MKRLWLTAPLVLALLACPKDDDENAQVPVDTIPRDTTPQDLGAITPDIPPPAPDTFTRPKLEPPQRGPSRYPAAPAALMEAVEREQAFSNFCYREFGLKSDPRLRGGVAMIVTVGRNGVSAARVAADTWSSSSGKAVNECLNERAVNAWKVSPGDVKAGTYQVDLRFTGGT
ncbi:MAG TPA: hypothetical protein VJ650_09455 [Gemmatimonadaceae bacterium]|nr:hypothetical protein [Gemmatimonadaceae bacterium]